MLPLKNFAQSMNSLELPDLVAIRYTNIGASIIKTIFQNLASFGFIQKV